MDSYKQTKGHKMTEFEKQCYGMSEADIHKYYMDSCARHFSGMEMVVMGILSDCQELSSWSNSNEDIRKKLNIAKYILSEMLEEKSTQLA
jgi:hypothetical protein